MLSAEAPALMCRLPQAEQLALQLEAARERGRAQGLRSSLTVPPPLQNVAVEGDSGASGVAIGLVGGSRAVGRGKVAGSGVRAPSSAVKNSLAGCHLPAAGGESFSTRPRTSILHDPRGILNRSENG